MTAMQPNKSITEESLDATVTYLEGLPTGTSTDSAVKNILSWQETLTKSGKAEFNEISTELGNLASLLSNGALDGKAIGRSMIKIGEDTMKASNQVDQTVGTRLKVLGNWLKKVGESL